ncbi:MAG TPA: hypothetical protein VD814_12025 [Nocardioides sp.]|nr:hypothetical protein [Nocardioides sp.]
MTQPPSPPPRRARHLIDPASPPPRSSGSMSLTQVQAWVLSVLAVTTILHLSAGLVVASLYVDPDKPVARVGLLVIAGAFGVIAVAAGLAIHQRPILSGWLALGWLPTLLGAWVVLGR